MPRRRPYALTYAPDVKRHLGAIERRHYPLIRATLEEQLRFEPDAETRNRKPLRQPAVLEAQWELRFGSDNRFRVFYEIDHENRAVPSLPTSRETGERVRNRVEGGERRRR